MYHTVGARNIVGVANVVKVTERVADMGTCGGMNPVEDGCGGRRVELTSVPSIDDGTVPAAGMTIAGVLVNEEVAVTTGCARSVWDWLKDRVAVTVGSIESMGVWFRDGATLAPGGTNMTGVGTPSEGSTLTPSRLA